MHKFQYPKLLGLVLSTLLAYLLYHYHAFAPLPELLNGHGYVSVFIGGIMFSFGFTSPIAIALLLEIGPFVHPAWGALVAAVGATLADLTIFRFACFSVRDELLRMQTTRFFVRLHDIIHHERIPLLVREYLLWSIAGIIIASPLPDEIGLTLVSGIRDVHEKPLMALCFTFNALGIFITLLIGRSLVA